MTDKTLAQRQAEVADALRDLAGRTADALKAAQPLEDEVQDAPVAGYERVTRRVSGLRASLIQSEALVREVSMANDVVQDGWSKKALESAQALLATQRVVYDRGVAAAMDGFRETIGAAP